MPRVDEVDDVDDCWEEGHHRFVTYEMEQMVGFKVHLPGDLILNKFKPTYYGLYQVV